MSQISFSCFGYAGKRQLVANLDDGTFPNHVATDGQGTVFAVNKSKGPDDQDGDRITRITQIR